ncbi:hypothetical protein PROPEN_03772 [Proteus penneri ATCC 35198]|nr:hypothetical protein PROPEN_03772 [Proteus penneri ATCC 35198]
MNEFSIVCRLLGTLFQRDPKDPILSPIIKMIAEGKLSQLWPLEQDELFNTLKKVASKIWLSLKLIINLFLLVKRQLCQFTPMIMKKSKKMISANS